MVFPGSMMYSTAISSVFMGIVRLRMSAVSKVMVWMVISKLSFTYPSTFRVIGCGVPLMVTRPAIDNAVAVPAFSFVVLKYVCPCGLTPMFSDQVSIRERPTALAIFFVFLFSQFSNCWVFFDTNLKKGKTKKKK